MCRRFLIVLCLCVFGLTSCNSRTTIVNSIPEREANEIVVLLNSKGIEAVKTAAAVSAVGGGTGEKMWDIQVPAQQITESLAVLNQAGLPRLKGTSLLQLFGSQGLVPSDLQDRIRYQEGLSEQLATTIRKMDGIIDANVQITFPKDEEEQKELTASVYVKHRGILDNPNSLAITKIKRLIASAVPGMKPENVSVVTDRAVYADITLHTASQVEEPKEFVSIWSVAVAKESTFRFRLIFYTFIFLLFLLACALAWLVWKTLPVIQHQGGIQALLRTEQFRAGEKEGKHDKEDEE